ncbi:hypothetical protein IJH46_01570 [Candidatus Saccharibacteria bacterium]|nr:hypothetical protein [Candidatus Saccharibacteria bacterium]
MIVNKRQKNLIVILVSAFVAILIIFTAISLVLHSRKNFAKNPTVFSLETDGSTLIVRAQTGFPESAIEQILNEQFVYCVQKVEGAENCEWENYDDFELDEETDYYIYVKSLTTEKISDVKKFTYKKIDFESLRI